MAGGAVAALVICILVVVIVSVIGVGCFVMKSGGEAEGHASDITIEPEGVRLSLPLQLLSSCSGCGNVLDSVAACFLHSNVFDNPGNGIGGL